MVSALIDLIANLFGFARGRQDAANTPDMKANAAAKQAAAAEERITEEIKNQDADALRKELAE